MQSITSICDWRFLGNPSSSKEKVTSDESTQESRLSPNNRHLSRQHHVNDKAGSRSVDNDSLLPSSKIENREADDIQPTDKNGVSNCVSSIAAGHAKLKRLLGTLVQFATDISPDTGDTVRSLVMALLVHFLKIYFLKISNNLIIKTMSIVTFCELDVFKEIFYYEN